jgi:signal transduction histidine kinase
MVVLAALAGTCAAFLRWRRARLAAGALPLVTEPVLLVAEGRILDLSAPARERLGLARGAALDPALERLFGGEADSVRGAMAEAVGRGRPARRLIRTPCGRAHELALEPQGGTLRLTLRDGGFLESALGAAAGPSEAPPAGAPPPEDALAPLASALGAASGAIVWRRDADGALIASAGEIAAEAGRADAPACVAALDAARRAGPGEVPGAATTAARGPERVEVTLEGEATLPVQVVEAADGAGGTIGLAMDAGPAARAEATLGRFVQTMTQTFASLTVGLAIFDRNQRLVLFNPSAAEVWQVDPAWLATRPLLRDILDELRSKRRIPDGRDYHGWRDGLLELFESPDSADYTELWTLSDGCTLRVLARPHAHGALAFIFEDVTERVHLERRYRRMEDLYRATLDRLDEGLMVLGPDGALRYVNSAFHEIWHTDEANVRLGMHVGQLCDLCSRQAVDQEVWERLNGFVTGASSRRAWAARVIMGSGRILSARFAALPDGSTMAVFGDATDSERVAMALSERNEALEAAEQMRGAVLDQISHRLRTPLNTIFGFAQLLADPRFGALTERQQNYASGVLEAAAQLLDTISEVTELASLQIDPLDGEEAGPSVEEVLEITRELLDRRADRSGVELVLATESPVGTIGGSAMHLRQIVFNLAADAIHRCAHGGRVRLGARRLADGRVTVTTEETAEPGAGGGGGLGLVEVNSLTLSLVRRLVAAEGGTLSIEESPDGATLTVSCVFPDALALVEEESGHTRLTEGAGPR